MLNQEQSSDPIYRYIVGYELIPEQRAILIVVDKEKGSIVLKINCKETKMIKECDWIKKFYGRENCTRLHALKVEKYE